MGLVGELSSCANWLSETRQNPVPNQWNYGKAPGGHAIEVGHIAMSQCCVAISAVEVGHIRGSVRLNWNPAVPPSKTSCGPSKNSRQLGSSWGFLHEKSLSSGHEITIFLGGEPCPKFSVMSLGMTESFPRKMHHVKFWNDATGSRS